MALCESISDAVDAKYQSIDGREKFFTCDPTYLS